jgi:peptidoglycan hydrolase CwlO-like protein
MKSLILLSILLTLAGCAASPKNKVYRNEISFYNPKPQKVLYAGKEPEKLPDECYEINFPDADIAENKLKIQMMCQLYEHNEGFLSKAQKELKDVQKFTADLKTGISERNKQYQQLKELEKQIAESRQKVEQLKSGEKK